MELNNDGDLVYVWEPLNVFMSAEEIAAGYYRVCTGTKDQSDTFEVINIHKPDGSFDRFFFGCFFGYGQISTITPAFIYADPTSPTTAKALVTPGTVFPTADGVTLVYDDVLYYQVGSTPLGRAWVKADDFTLLAPDSYLPRVDCDDEGLEEGKIETCD